MRRKKWNNRTSGTHNISIPYNGKTLEEFAPAE
jgi:hypothetical protein